MSDFTVVFVGGLGRSGSTLIERALGELPGVCSVGELVHLWQRGLIDNERCGCGAPFSGCAFWRDVGWRAFGGWHCLDPDDILALRASVDRTRYVPWLLGRTPSPALAARLCHYTDLYDHVYAAIASVSGCDVVVDSSKHASLAACLRHRYGERMRVVHVVRDPRAVAHAWGKRVPRPDATPTSPEQEMARYSPGRAAVQWTAQNAVFAALARTEVPVHRVRYEDFVAAPAARFAEVAGFIGHQGELPITADGHVYLSTTHTVSGNPTRFRTGAVAVRADDTWREELAPRDRALVAAMTLPFRMCY
ncbi:sulfotransferase [Salinactinospora qingdaonensis]|uniref:Sulfotransferase n=1 Tax=Salinactinospora qingdaonensis TaxID=702744 RepID=A0ABP7FRC6_9ACTN